MLLATLAEAFALSALLTLLLLVSVRFLFVCPAAFGGVAEEVRLATPLEAVGIEVLAPGPLGAVEAPFGADDVEVLAPGAGLVVVLPEVAAGSETLM